MGSEITRTVFDAEAYATFRKRLEEETRTLRELWHKGALSRRYPVGGFEIEGWLVDGTMDPADANRRFLDAYGNPLATMELAQFNFEINNTPHRLEGDAFARFAYELGDTCRRAEETAEQMGLHTLFIGTLPTARREHFSLAHMSPMRRYRALNAEVLKERRGKPLAIDIAGEEERLRFTHDSVMLEAAATSFQIHTQVPWESAHHYYNAALMLSAATVALSANAPFLFGKALWAETRIPIFEQSVDTNERKPRVSFGSGYAHGSIVTCFEENLRDYDVLIPLCYDTPPEAFSHLKLHNGTIWRWNRPLVGADEDGTPHLRIEHRVMPAGPTLEDMLANALFYYGASHTLAHKAAEGWFACDFDAARENFYAAARKGLDADVVWEGKPTSVRALIADVLVPAAEAGARAMGVRREDIVHYLDIVRARAASGRNGAWWQRACAKALGGDVRAMTQAYRRLQREGKPVHTWEVSS